MKLSVIAGVFIVLFCIHESDSFKILKKLSDILHPTVSTVSTTAVLPTIPDFEKRHAEKEDDSRSWERESPPSNIKKKHSNEDESTSQSSEVQESNLKNSKLKYNAVRPGKTKSYPEDLSQSNTLTWETNKNNISLGNNKGNSQYSSYSSSKIREVIRTTTDVYHQSDKNGNYPSQSSSIDGNNLEVKSKIPNNYGFGNQNQTEQSYAGINNKENGTAENNYNGSYSLNTYGQSSSFGSALVEIPSTTPVNLQVLVGNYEGVGQSASVGSSFSSQDQNHDDQSSAFSVSKNEISNVTNNQKSTSRNTTNLPENPPSYGYFSSGIPTTTPTPTFDKTYLNEVEPEPISGNNYNAGSTGSTSTTSMTSDHSLTDSSNQNGNQYNKPPGKQPPYSTMKGSNQTKYQGGQGGIIIFPDDPSLNPTTEPEQTFERSGGLNKTTRAPVDELSERRIIDALPKSCGEGKIFDQKTKVCRKIARK